MKQQWYKSNVAKGILIVAQHILLVIIVTSFMWMMSYPALRGELFVGKPAKKYEDTVSFGNQLLTISHDVANGIKLRKMFETDGSYDPQRIVDIEEYYKNREINNKNSSGPAAIQDLYNWGRNGMTKEKSHLSIRCRDSIWSQEVPSDDNIIVCKRSNDTYHYYYYSEFRNLIDSGQLRFVISNENEGMSGEEIWMNCIMEAAMKEKIRGSSLRGCKTQKERLNL